MWTFLKTSGILQAAPSQTKDVSSGGAESAIRDAVSDGSCAEKRRLLSGTMPKVLFFQSISSIFANFPWQLVTSSTTGVALNTPTRGLMLLPSFKAASSKHPS